MRLTAIAFGVGIGLLTVAPATAQDAFGEDRRVEEGVLGEVAGRANVNAIAQADQNNEVSGNSVSGHSVTGAVQIDGNAFQNLSGLSVVNANTGNNVAINAAMNVNISLSTGM